MGQQGLQAFVWELQTCKLSPTPEGIHSGYTTAMLQNHKQTIRGVRCIGNAQASVVRSPRMRRRRTRITRSRHRGGSQNKPFAGPGKRAPPKLANNTTAPGLRRPTCKGNGCASDHWTPCGRAAARTIRLICSTKRHCSGDHVVAAARGLVDAGSPRAAVRLSLGRGVVHVAADGLPIGKPPGCSEARAETRSHATRCTVHVGPRKACAVSSNTRH